MLAIGSPVVALLNVGNVQSLSMVLTGNSMGIVVKFGINSYHSCCVENRNFNATLMVFILNFTASHAITSTNFIFMVFLCVQIFSVTKKPKFL